MNGWLIRFAGITRSETLRFANQRGRFLAALVRALVWLFIFAAGFRAVLGLSITPALRNLCSLRGLCDPRPVRHDPAFQRDAILTVDGP